MLLVDDDEPEVARVGANTAERVPTTTSTSPATDPLPLVVPLAVRQAAVLDGHAVAERLPEQRGHLRRQRNLRDRASARGGPRSEPSADSRR